MANRSYLYSVDTVPSGEHRPRPIRGISEHNWGIPLMHQLLAGRGTSICPSVIWEHPIGVVADYAEGVRLGTDFLRVLGEGDSAAHAEVRASAATIAAFLDDPQQVGRYFLLETGEILDLTDTALDAGVRDLVEHEIPAAVRLAEGAIAGREPEWLARVLADWRTHIDSFYSQVLYFSFGSH